MLAKVTSCSVVGLDGALVNVEVEISGGQSGLTIVGLPDTAVQESRERVSAAVKNSAFSCLLKRISVNLVACRSLERRFPVRFADCCRIVDGFGATSSGSLVLALEESLEITHIYSANDMLPADSPLNRHRPFHAPHQTISHAALLAGHAGRTR